MKDLIQKLAETDDELYAKIGTVETVDLTNKTCDVIPLDGSAKIMDVYYQADSDNGGIVIAPKVNSLVCVVFINKETAILANTGELDFFEVQVKKTVLEVLKNKIQLTQNQSVLSVEDDGFLLKKGSESLKKLINDLVTAIQNQSFSVTTTGTAATHTGTTTMLVNKAEFIALAERFNQFLK